MTFWDPLRRSTQARIGLGRAGNALPTVAELEFRAAHAAARDAVHEPLDVSALVAATSSVGLGEPLVVRSAAGDRAEYLRRPDLGRRLAPAAPPIATVGGDLAVVLADGLSARAVSAHAVRVLTALLPHLAFPPDVAENPAAHATRPGGKAVVRLVVATQARVGLGDPIGAALGVRAVLVLIGERPGLSVADSLGAYWTWDPGPGRTDAERNCVSNIHPPDGLGYEAAASVLAGIIRASFDLHVSGVALKDRSTPALEQAAAGRLEA